MWWWWESAFLSEGFRKEFISLPFTPFRDSLPLFQSLNLATLHLSHLSSEVTFPSILFCLHFFLDLLDHIWILIIIQSNFPISRSLLLPNLLNLFYHQMHKFQGSGQEYSEASLIWFMTHIGENPRIFNLLYSSDNPLHYSCLENSMGRGTWQATVHEVAELDMTGIHACTPLITICLKLAAHLLQKWNILPFLRGYEWMMWSPNVHSI